MKPEERVQRELDDVAAQVGYRRLAAFDQGYRPQRCPGCGRDLGKGAGGTRQTLGVSDRLYARPRALGGVVWVEVKAGDNGPTEHQETFLRSLRSFGEHAFPAWCLEDLLWGFATAGDRRFGLPPWAATSKGFRQWIEELYPAALDALRAKEKG